MKIIAVIMLFLFFPFLIFANTESSLPQINSESAIMIDYETGTVLYEKNADIQIPPASMTKLMTIFTALNLVEAGKAGLDDVVPISESADYRNAPPHSSLMFLEQGQVVTLKELLLGLAISSGNDAGIAVAEYLAGSMQSFILLMNSNAVKIGLQKTYFVDSSGYSPKNLTTARDYALFCKEYIQKYGDYLEYFHCKTSFTYPKENNLPPSGYSTHGPITQNNHNLLVDRLEGVDGLKTGFINESGYNIAATAQKNGRRIILVLMGGPGATSSDGNFRRTIDAAYLFAYGFYRWERFAPKFPENELIDIKGGDKGKLKINYSKAKAILINAEDLHKFKIERTLNEISFPLQKGDIIGQWHIVSSNKKIIQSGNILAAENVKKAGLFKSIFRK